MKRRRFSAEFKRKVVLRRRDGAVDCGAAQHQSEPGGQVEVRGPRGAARGFPQGERRHVGGRIGAVGRAALRADRRVYGGAGFFSEGFAEIGRVGKVKLIREDASLSLSRKCALAGVSRSSLYHAPKPPDARRLDPRRLVDELYMAFTYYGTRRVSLHLRREGHDVGRDMARGLIVSVRWRTVYPQPRTSQPASERDT